MAGNSGNLIENSTRRSDPIIKDGIDTKAVVTTIITLSIILLRLSAATDPRTMPQISALNAAITPSFADVLRPSEIISITFRPRRLRDGPKSNFVTISAK